MASLDLAPASVCVTWRADGTRLVASTVSLPQDLPTIIGRLAFWIEECPERPLIAEREGAGWNTLTYAQAMTQARRVAEALTHIELSPERPLMIIANASVRQLVLRLGAMVARVPFVPVSPGLMKYGSPEKVAEVLDKFRPGLVALSKSIGAGTDWPGVQTTDLDEFVDSAVRGQERSSSADALLPGPSADDVAAYFLTSGSTGAPKAVTVTHKMISFTQASYNGIWPFLEHAPPRLLDWLPWHHTFGGNDNIHKIIWNGGTYFVDDGLPTREGFLRTKENMALCSPTIHFNVPKGLDQLVAHLEADPDFARRLFRSLDAIFFAAAGLSNHTWRRLLEIKPRIEHDVGRNVHLLSGYGASEAGSIITLVHFPVDRPSNIGLPVPGATVKLVPNNGKLEARVKGPAVMPCYFDDEKRTADAFDGEGYYLTGDALRFLNDAEPQLGLLFDGRIAEDFKLASGTWVSVGPLRGALLSALRPLVAEVIIAGHDQDAVGVLIFLDATSTEVLDPGELSQELSDRLGRHNAENPSNSVSVRFARIEAVPLDPAFGEVTDKGSANQRAVLQRRPDSVRRMFGAQSDDKLNLNL